MARKKTYKPAPIVEWAWKSYKRNARENARACRQAEKQALREQKEQAREQKRAAKEEVAFQQQRAREDAEFENRRLEQCVQNLKSLHRPLVERSGPLDLDLLLQEVQPVEFRPTLKPPKEGPVPPLETYLQAVRPPSLFERMFGSSRYEDDLANARRKHLADLAARERTLKEHADALESARQEHVRQEAEKEQAHRHLEAVRSGLLESQPEAIARYCELRLGSVDLPDDMDVDFTCEYVDGSMNVTIVVPDRTVVPEIASVKYVIKRDETQSIPRKDEEIRPIYQSAIAGLLVGAIHCTFASDAGEKIGAVLAKAVIPGHDRCTGQPGLQELASVLVTRDQWASIDTMHIEPIACLQGLSGDFGERWKSL